MIRFAGRHWKAVLIVLAVFALVTAVGAGDRRPRWHLSPPVAVSCSYHQVRLLSPQRHRWVYKTWRLYGAGRSCTRVYGGARGHS